MTELVSTPVTAPVASVPPLPVCEAAPLAVAAPDARHLKPQLLGVRAPGAGAGKLLAPLEDRVPGDHGVEWRRVGDQEARPLLDGDTRPHLEPVVRPEDEAAVGDAAVVEERHPGVEAGEVVGGAGGEYLERVGVEDAEDGQNHFLLCQAREQGTELSRLQLSLQKLRLILPELEIC